MFIIIIIIIIIYFLKFMLLKYVSPVSNITSKLYIVSKFVIVDLSKIPCRALIQKLEACVASVALALTVRTSTMLYLLIGGS
jgi:hypothetical protein